MDQMMVWKLKHFWLGSLRRLFGMGKFSRAITEWVLVSLAPPGLLKGRFTPVWNEEELQQQWSEMTATTYWLRTDWHGLEYSPRTTGFGRQQRKGFQHDRPRFFRRLTLRSFLGKPSILFCRCVIYSYIVCVFKIDLHFH